ncbi:hypothetical protein MS10711_3104 [Escherichia coli]|nr:hypothetical protein MS10711_3104 [Escherichia coli]
MADCSPPGGGTLAGTTTLNNGAILTLSGKTVNNDTLTIREGDALLQGGSLTGNGSVEKIRKWHTHCQQHHTHPESRQPE